MRSLQQIHELVKTGLLVVKMLLQDGVVLCCFQGRCYAPRPTLMPRARLFVLFYPYLYHQPALPPLPDLSALAEISMFSSMFIYLASVRYTWPLPLLAGHFPTPFLTPSCNSYLHDSSMRESFLTLFLRILLLLTKYDTAHLLSHFHGLPIYTHVPMTRP